MFVLLREHDGDWSKQERKERNVGTKFKNTKKAPGRKGQGINFANEAPKGGQR